MHQTVRHANTAAFRGRRGLGSEAHEIERPAGHTTQREGTRRSGRGRRRARVALRAAGPPLQSGGNICRGSTGAVGVRQARLQAGARPGTECVDAAGHAAIFSAGSAAADALAVRSARSSRLNVGIDVIGNARSRAVATDRATDAGAARAPASNARRVAAFTGRAAGGAAAAIRECLRRASGKISATRRERRHAQSDRSPPSPAHVFLLSHSTELAERLFSVGQRSIARNIAPFECIGEERSR